MRRTIMIGFCSLALLLAPRASALADEAADKARDLFWNKFSAAVIRKDKAAVASLAQFPVGMSYGIRSIRTRAQFIKRYDEVFHQQGDAVECFKTAKPEVDPAKPKLFSVACKDIGGNEVLLYHFALTRNGWRFTDLDNINE